MRVSLSYVRRLVARGWSLLGVSDEWVLSVSDEELGGLATIAELELTRRRASWALVEHGRWPV